MAGYRQDSKHLTPLGALGALERRIHTPGSNRCFLSLSQVP